MTQVDTFVEEEHPPSSGSGKNGNGNPSSTGTQDQDPSPPQLKTIKIYQNGYPSTHLHCFTLDKKEVQPWSQVLHSLHEAVNVPVQKVFTVRGKRVVSWSEVQKLDEIVVCGNEHFKMLPYGKESPKDQRVLDARNSRLSKTVPKTRTKNKVERANLVKSVIVEPSRVPGNGYRPNPIMKTLSEQDVSEKSSKIRVRQSSPKPRPVSAYQQVNMTSSADRRALGMGVSKIPVPKRATTSSMSPLYSIQNNANNGTPTTLPGMQIKPKRIVQEKLAYDSNSRPDASRNEFVRPRLVTVIRGGMKPRKAVRFLLNKKTARSYDQVLNELTDSIKPDWGAVRKVYTISGSEVTCLEDFFGEDDIFLACPNDRVGTNDFELDSEECKAIQPYCKASLAVKQFRFRGLELSRSPYRRPKSGSGTQSQPSHPKYIPLAHFPAAILDKYYVGNIIGDGNFAVVRECTERATRNRFALKVIDKAKCQGRDAPPEHEVKILSMVCHSNIVEMYEQFDFTNELYIVMELIEGGDLFDAIATVTKFSEPESICMTRDVASALSFLHCLRIVHRDIKPENLLVYTEGTGQRRIKLGDFGLAKIADGLLYTVCGTPTYVAPEILQESGYGLKVDIWALGVIVYVLLCGYPPFVSPTGDQEELFDLILTSSYDFPDADWSHISRDAKDLITKMIDQDVDMRLSADEVLDHPWLSVMPEGCSKRHRKRQEGDLSFKVFEQMGLPISLPNS